MNPHQKNKIDIGALSPDEQRLFRLYGKLPNKKDLLQNKLKERKYFDSGDYALSKAGKASDTGVTTIGTEHPQAADIPHMSPLTYTMTRGESFSGPSSGMLGTSPEGLPMLPGAGIHRGSINGIPGGGLPGATGRSPVKESSFLARHASRDENQVEEEDAVDPNSPEGQAKAAREKVGMSSYHKLEGSVSPPPKREGIPIRR